MIPGLDPAAWRSELLAAARTAFREVRERHAGERFYAFALHVDEPFERVVASSHSEEALARAAGGNDGEAAARRWDVAGWAYHGEGEAGFARANAILAAADLGSRLGELDEARFDAVVDAIHDLLAGVLADLDAEGLFGDGAGREETTVLVAWGERDDHELLRLAERLNPPVVADRLADELFGGDLDDEVEDD